MKISDGNWLIHEGLQILYPVHVHDIQVRGKELLVHAAPRDVSSRAFQLDTALLTLRLFSPQAGVIGVRIERYQGVYPVEPNFALNRDEDLEVQIRLDEDEATLTSGSLTVRIARRGDWAIDFLRDTQAHDKSDSKFNIGSHVGGRVVDTPAFERLTGSGFRAAGHVTETGGGTHVFERLDLGVGETVYGLGERFAAFVKNGQTIDIWNRDGGTGTEQAYKNIPFYLTNRGYGVFVNHPGRVEFEVATEKVAKVQFSVPGEGLEYFVIDGPSPKAVLDRYTRLTGRPALPPAWSFGLWLTTSFTTDYDEATVNSFIDGMRERSLPLHVFHFDCFWMRAFHWCDFEWNPATFPDPAGMLRRLKDKGLHICVWINPYIAQPSPLFAEGMAQGYLLRKPDGRVWQWDKWQPGQAVVDFTNPAACEWYAGHLRRLLAMGVDSFKTDFGERIPTDVVYHDGSDPERMHNYYAFLYNKIVYEVLAEVRGPKDAVLFARAAAAGSQQFPVHWGGDSNSTYESMAESLRGGLSLGLSGFGFWSHDIGGFENTAPAHIYKRWCAFGLLSSHSRLHGSKSYRVPWLFDEEAVDVLRHFTEWKSRLMPYLYSEAALAARDGTPLMRAMLLEFAHDRACDYLDRQYMLGGSVLVAPVFSERGEVDFYLPAGRWTHLFTDAEAAGGSWRRERHGFMSVPIYVRPNTLLAIGADASRPDYDYANEVDLRLYALDDGAQAEAVVRGLDGEIRLRATVRRTEVRLNVELEGNDHPCTLSLQNIATSTLRLTSDTANTANTGSTVATAKSETNGTSDGLTVESGARHTRIRIAANVRRFTIEL
jgi:alpha-D-xyloside xylohydrolase